MIKYFVEINDNHVVTNAICINNPGPLDDKSYIANVLKLEGNWIENTGLYENREIRAGVECTYDPEVNAFIRPSPFPSWTLDESYKWQPPIPEPESSEGEISYYWNEETLSWVKPEL